MEHCKQKQDVLDELEYQREIISQCGFDDLCVVVADVLNEIPKNILANNEWINNETALSAINYHHMYHCDGDSLALNAAVIFINNWISLIIDNLATMGDYLFITKANRDRDEDFIVLFGKCKRVKTHRADLLYGCELHKLLNRKNVRVDEDLACVLTELTYQFDDWRKSWQ